MKFSDFEFDVHLGGPCIHCELPNGNGISIVNNKYSYSDKNTFEIAPLHNGEFMMSDNGWGDDVKGYITPEQIDQIIEHMYNDTPEQYINFLKTMI